MRRRSTPGPAAVPMGTETQPHATDDAARYYCAAGQLRDIGRRHPVDLSEVEQFISDAIQTLTQRFPEMDTVPENAKRHDRSTLHRIRRCVKWGPSGCQYRALALGKGQDDRPKCLKYDMARATSCMWGMVRRMFLDFGTLPQAVEANDRLVEAWACVRELTTAQATVRSLLDRINASGGGTVEMEDLSRGDRYMTAEEPVRRVSTTPMHLRGGPTLLKESANHKPKTAPIPATDDTIPVPKKKHIPLPKPKAPPKGQPAKETKPIQKTTPKPTPKGAPAIGRAPKGQPALPPDYIAAPQQPKSADKGKSRVVSFDAQSFYKDIVDRYKKTGTKKYQLCLVHNDRPAAVAWLGGLADFPGAANIRVAWISKKKVSEPPDNVDVTYTLGPTGMTANKLDLVPLVTFPSDKKRKKDAGGAVSQHWYDVVLLDPADTNTLPMVHAVTCHQAAGGRWYCTPSNDGLMRRGFLQPVIVNAVYEWNGMEEVPFTLSPSKGDGNC